MTELPAHKLLIDAIAVLERLGIPYAVMGGFAVRAWGIPRPTYDADVAVGVDGVKLKELLLGLEVAGFTIPEEHKRGWIDSVQGLQKVKATRFHASSVWDVDLFIADHPLLRSALDRRRALDLGEGPIQVMSAEDIILLKLLAFRRKDQLDVEEVLKIVPEPDLAYLRSWADRLQVRERLERFLQELRGPGR